jgi:hypothetical protein
VLIEQGVRGEGAAKNRDQYDSPARLVGATENPDVDISDERRGAP